MTKQKKYAILVPLTLVLLVSAWQGLRFWWLRAYSRGSRTGLLRKVSVKGSPVCKYLSGELIPIGTPAGQTPEIFEFSVDDDSPTNPVVLKLHAAEKAAQPITVDYRQDKGKWWACAPTEYYVINVE